MNHSDTTSATIDRLQRTLERVSRSRRDLPEPQVLLSAPGVEWSFGERRRRFHTASVGKAMTATLAFQLAERGALDLDAPLTRVLPRAEWRGLFVDSGVDRAGEVTVAQLLSHTSGAADYFDGRVRTGRRFRAEIVADPHRRWTPDDLLEWSRLRQRPAGAPGQRFAYSDTGFVLAARAIEEAGGASLGAQLHERILAPAGMDDSCLLFHTMPGGGSPPAEPADVLDIAPLWLGRTEFSRAAALSCDWGGGGVVSTVDDLVRFSRSWHGGELVGEESRTRMARAAHRFRPGIRYGTGLMQLRYEGFSPFLRGMPRLLGHLGVTGAHLFGDAGSGIHLAMNFHSTSEMLRSFRTHITLVREVLTGATD